MGKYAFYIWSAYGISFVVLVSLTFHLWNNLRAQTRMLAQLEKEGGPRRPRAVGPEDDPVQDGQPDE